MPVKEVGGRMPVKEVGERMPVKEVGVRGYKNILFLWSITVFCFPAKCLYFTLQSTTMAGGARRATAPPQQVPGVTLPSLSSR